MSNLSEMELQNLRHLLLASETEEKKYAAYEKEAQDPAVKQYFQKAAQSAIQNKQTFMGFLK